MSDKHLKPLHQHNAEMLAAAKIGKDNPHRNGLSCPYCEKELIDSEPGVVLLTCPPRYRVWCPNCDYKGTRF